MITPQLSFTVQNDHMESPSLIRSIQSPHCTTRCRFALENVQLLDSASSKEANMLACTLAPMAEAPREINADKSGLPYYHIFILHRANSPPPLSNFRNSLEHRPPTVVECSARRKEVAGSLRRRPRLNRQPTRAPFHHPSRRRY